MKQIPKATAKFSNSKNKLDIEYFKSTAKKSPCTVLKSV